MASIQKEILINASPDAVWSALREFGALHTRLAKGFVTDTRLVDEGRKRIVTFSNGSTAQEILVGLDDGLKRIAYAVVESAQITQHSASAQVFDAGENQSRFVWTTDLLPDAVAPYISAQMDLGAAAIKKTLEEA